MPRAFGITAKQRRFVEEYLLDLNASAAARRAGYACTSAGPLMALPAVKEAIQAEMDARSVRTHVRLDSVLLELKRLAMFDPATLFDADGNLLPLDQMPEDARHSIAGIEVNEVWEGFGEDRAQTGVLKKVKLLDRNSALDKLMKHLGAYAADKLEIKGALTLRDLLPGAKLPEAESAPEPTLDDELDGVV
jgi:phage terminase small subunit